MNLNCDNKDAGIGERFSSFLRSFPGGPNPEIQDEYVNAFVEVLASFEQAGMDTEKTVARLEAALAEREVGDVVRTACELTAAFSFQRRFPSEFRYEVPSRQGKQSSGPPSDFDFAFSAHGRDFNVEVKCFDRDSAQDLAPCKIFNKPLRIAVDEEGGDYSPNRMQALLRFLKKANNQLVRPDNGLSVVILCCKDWDVMADVLECLLGRNGVLNTAYPGSRLLNDARDAVQVERSLLENIDAVVICDVGMYHEAAIRRTSFAVASGPDVLLSLGAQPWEYTNSIPFGFFVNAESINDELQAEFSRLFNLRTTLLHKCLLENGNKLQRAMFDVCNAQF